MMVRRSGEVQMNVSGMSGEQVNIKSQSELDIGGRETCKYLNTFSQGSGVDLNISVLPTRSVALIEIFE